MEPFFILVPCMSTENFEIETFPAWKCSHKIEQNYLFPIPFQDFFFRKKKEIAACIRYCIQLIRNTFSICMPIWLLFINWSSTVSTAWLISLKRNLHKFKEESIFRITIASAAQKEDTQYVHLRSRYIVCIEDDDQFYHFRGRETHTHIYPRQILENFQNTIYMILKGKLSRNDEEFWTRKFFSSCSSSFPYQNMQIQLTDNIAETNRVDTHRGAWKRRTAEKRKSRLGFAANQ